MAGLLLDENNPRFVQPVDSQKEAINALLADAPLKLLRLAEDIASEGAVNPTELPVVVEEDGNLIVVEGNRRLAALKLLRNPVLADAPEHQRRLQALAKEDKGPDSLVVFHAASRDDAKHWIDLRHTGENDGVGVVGWESWQSNNFRRRRGSQADRATMFCNAVVQDFPDESQLLADIETVRRERLTTLGRLVADPDVRRDFGFDFRDDQIVFHFDPIELLPGFKKIFRDLAGEVGVSQIKSKEQRQEYLKESHQELPPRQKRLTEARAPGPVETVEAESATEGSGGTKKTRRTMPRSERVIFQGLTLAKVDLRTSKLLREAQTIEIDAAPGVAAILVRVIVELVVTEANVRLSTGVGEAERLKRKLGSALLAIDPNMKDPGKRDKSLEPAWVRSQDEHPLIVQTMHAFVHNVMANPTAGEVRELSRTFRPLLEQLDLHLGKVSKS